MLKSIVFSLELITDHFKNAPANAQVSQFWTSISNLRGTVFGVAVMINRCTQRIGGSWRRWIIGIRRMDSETAGGRQESSHSSPGDDH
jgi:hypothetical protein